MKVPAHIVYNLSGEYRDHMLQTGGFAVARFDTEEQKEQALVHLKDHDLPAYEATKAIVVGVPYIAVVKEIADKLPQEEFLAILLHEEGHLKLNHASEYTKLSVVDAHELEADAYAASIVGKATMKRALKRICLVLGVALGSSGLIKGYRNAISCPHFQMRFNALS